MNRLTDIEGGVRISACSIRMSPKRNKMHIHKTTLDALGRPPFIQLLVNQEKKLMMIRGCDGKQRDCIAIPASNMAEGTAGIYIYRKLFIDALCNLAGWNLDRVYRIPGNIVPCDENIVVFHLTDAMLLLPNDRLGPDGLPT